MAKHNGIPLDRTDIQGLVVRAFTTLPAARYALLSIDDASAARRWLELLVNRVTAAAERPSTDALNIAITHAGLQALGLDSEALDTFAFEFREGMSAEHRQAILGDDGESAPQAWQWGGPGNDAVHLLLLIYAVDQQRLDAAHAELMACAEEGAVTEIHRLETQPIIDHEQGCAREHFGFCDGASQPPIEGLRDIGRAEYRVRLGEFVLGYPNEYGRRTVGPVVHRERDPNGLLTNAPETDRRDLGRNGTYLVFRQLHQHVKRFWSAIDERASQSGSANPEARVHLAAKMVGRWPSGAPLVKAPEHDRPELGKENTFAYHHEDPDGLRCPIGAHIRRSNPRDSLTPGPGTEASIEVNRRHQLLRRGRTYGAPLAASMDPADMLAAPEDGQERGLHFISINANISRQFEFVQHTWVNNPKFGGLYDETDPLIGSRWPESPLTGASFTVPDEPVRQRLTDLPRFVDVRGGAYFFLPSLRALRYLAALPELARDTR